MKNRWNSKEAVNCNNDPLRLRVYSSRLLGQEEDLVLHGGGNTSVKTKETNIFGEEEDIIYVKGSGWDLATIEAKGFAPVKLKTLIQMAGLENLSDVDMVKNHRMAMTDPSAPNPSVEAILHALIPFGFVDHTHADAVVTISNSIDGEDRIRTLYGESILIVPYVMPGFLLAKEIYRLTHGINWSKVDGIILLNHGVFTFDNDAKRSYDKMIDIVSKAEDYLNKEASANLESEKPSMCETLNIARLRKLISDVWGEPILTQIDNSKASTAFSNFKNLETIANKGPLTPDHIIRTKRTPLILSDNHQQDVDEYVKNYQQYFNEFNSGELTCLDAAPRWAVWPKHGTLVFGTSVKSCDIVRDITRHTMQAITQAEQLGGWHTLSQKDLFEMEYWVLEQEKLKKNSSEKPMQGKIALVTGAASGIGKATVERLVSEGAVVAALDIDPKIESSFSKNEVLEIVCDLTDSYSLNKAIERVVTHFGGLDMLVSNAGIFPKSFAIDEMDDATWQKSMDINVTSHQRVLKQCLPFLKLGIDPAVVIIGSKNVAAPGPGAAAYSVAKAGLTQLGRIAALELGKHGIRVNMLHPNAVYDTAIWTDEVLESRAEYYGLTVDEYKKNNVLKTEVLSKDVAEMAVQMLGSVFAKTTGAQIPIDGGNDRII